MVPDLEHELDVGPADLAAGAEEVHEEGAPVAKGRRVRRHHAAAVAEGDVGRANGHVGVVGVDAPALPALTANSVVRVSDEVGVDARDERSSAYSRMDRSSSSAMAPVFVGLPSRSIEIN